MAENKSEPILDLNTLVNRRTIRIDGKLYELKHPGELGLVEYHKLVNAGLTIRQRLKNNSSELAEDDLLAGSASIDAICRLVLLAPSEVQDRLTDDQRAQIAMVFMGLRRPAATAGAKAAAASSGKTSTGASKSRGSRGSTASRP